MVYVALIWFLALILAFLAFYFLYFLRNPKRNTPKKDCIISPANGTVHNIFYTNSKSVILEKGILGKVRTLTKDVADDCAIISITMTPMNVHYQRAPMEGKVISTKYESGKFHNAVKDSKNMKATLYNENNQILIKTKIGNIKVIQIAGFLARRIVCFVKKNQHIKKGQDIGLIKLGSQVSIILPNKKVKVIVKEGQYVIDGETIIAEKI